MFKFNKICDWKNIFLALALSVLIAPVYAHNKGIITGQVVDITGMPISDVSVSTKGAPAVTTNPGGVYTLTGVKQKSRILVQFAKAGYAPTQGTTSLARKEKNDDDNHDHDDDNHHKKISQVTLSKTMVKSGATQKLDSALGGSLNEKGFKVTFPANSLTTTGSVDVVISPLDVSTRDIAAAPGDFSAITARGQRVTLESFTMADFTITQNGQPVNLKRGATADIEMLLPANTPLISGLIKPLWYFNTANGRWQEEGTGSVAPSTTTPGRLAIFASVQHFTFWNSDQPLNSTAVQGRVVDPDGMPVAGASVVSYGVDYAGGSYSVATDANGNYCIQVRSGSTSSLTASKAFGGIVAKSSPLIITSGTAPTTCATGGAQLIPNIVLASRTTCISGDVRDASNAPVAGVTVYSTSGGFANTDINGVFQLNALESSSVTVFVVGYPPVTVTTPAAGSPCAVVQMRPSVTGGGTSCVSGLVYTCSPAFPQAGIVINASVVGSNLITSFTFSNANGVYCIDSLPANTTMSFSANGAFPAFVLGDTGAGGGSCLANNCNAGPAMDIFCY